MWNEPTEKQLAELPGLYATEEVALKDKELLMHFFLGSNDWYVCEFDGQDIFFGYVILNGDIEMAEWGYFSLSELKPLRVPPGIEVDRDLHWKPKQAGEIPEVKTYEQ